MPIVRKFAKSLLKTNRDAGKIRLPRVRYPALSVMARATPSSPSVSYDAKTQMWTLESDLTVSSDGYTIYVAKGFLTDLASVPRAAWWAIAPFELSVAAPIVHDYIYDYGYANVIWDNGQMTK